LKDKATGNGPRTGFVRANGPDSGGAMSGDVFRAIAGIERRVARAAGGDRAGALEELARLSHGRGAYVGTSGIDEHLAIRAAVAEVREAAPFRSPGGRFTFVDLFAGIGGIRLAAQRNGGRCVFSSEWDRHARQTYFANFGEFPFGDINRYAGQDMDDAAIDAAVPDHDLLAGGFPCQPFSQAGVVSRLGLGRAHGFECDTQGTLFFNIAKIVQVKRPRAVFLENVRNLVVHNKGQTLGVIRDTFRSLGYGFAHQVVNACTMVPQRRQRCYMVAFRDGSEFRFPDFSGPALPLGPILEQDVPDSFTLSENAWRSLRNRTERNKLKGLRFAERLADLDKPAHTLIARYYKDGRECLIPQEGRPPRMLTPRECARLQGFPEEFVTHASKNFAYRQFGNSVAVPVIQRILGGMAEALGAGFGSPPGEAAAASAA